MISANSNNEGRFKNLTRYKGVKFVDVKEYINESPRKRGRKSKKVQPVSLDYIHTKDGFYDGKIFYSNDKVTYTFVDNNEVIVLHYDHQKNDLFLKGHKILSIDMQPQLEYYLGRFKKCLMDNPKTAKFVKPFDAAIASLCDTN